MEIVTLYVIYYYGNDAEVYVVIFRVGISLIMVIVGDSGMIRLMVLIMM
jgi:hypothetical protein